MELFILIAYASFALCQENTTAAANDTASGDERVGWVSPSGSRRSTWDIIWSCLTVFLICSWKCTHLNIPSVSESSAGWHKTRPIPWWPFSKPRKTFRLPLFPEGPLLRKWRRKLGFMVLIAIAPEIVVALATEQCVRAWMDLKDVNNPEFTMSHAFFARMGGFVLRVYENHPVIGQENDVPKRRTGDECSDKARLGRDTEKQSNSKIQPPVCEEWLLDLKSIDILEASGISFNLNPEDIEDRAKADGFTKLFALVQAGWLVVQSIARKAAGLQITELELMTIAFTTCALVTYLLWWYKPFNAERANILDVSNSNPKQREVLKRLNDTDEIKITRAILGLNRPVVQDLDFDFFSNILFGFVDARKTDPPLLFASGALYASSAAFSAIHVAAYSWVFPSTIVQTLWRIFCLAALGTAMLPAVMVLFDSYIDSKHERTSILIVFTILGSLITNMLSRLMIICLTFYCFSSMPVSVYTDLDWTKFFPHFS